MTDIAVRKATENDREFMYQLHRAAMQEYVAQVWGWDEERQRRLFDEHFDPSRSEIVEYEGRDVGVVATVQEENELHIENIEILPEFQRRGIGTQIVKGILDEARYLRKAVTLQVLRINPARALYERLGFIVTGETETHYRMRRHARWAGRREEDE